LPSGSWIIGGLSGWEQATLGYKEHAWETVTMQGSLEHTTSQEESVCEAVKRAWEMISAKAARMTQVSDSYFDRPYL